MKRVGIAVALIAALLLATPQSAFAIGPERPQRNFGMKFLDVALVRPFSAIGAIASTVVGLALLPIAFPIGVGEELLTYTIVVPWRFTHGRYLGDFRYYEDGGTVTGANIQD